MRMISDEAINYLSQYRLWVLRDERGNALSVSYSPDGLDWADKSGRLLSVKGGYISKGKRIVTDPTPNGVKEIFVPRNKKHPYAQSTELNAVKKAYRLLYTPSSYDGLLIL